MSITVERCGVKRYSNVGIVRGFFFPPVLPFFIRMSVRIGLSDLFYGSVSELRVCLIPLCIVPIPVQYSKYALSFSFERRAPAGQAGPVLQYRFSSLSLILFSSEKNFCFFLCKYAHVIHSMALCFAVM